MSDTPQSPKQDSTPTPSTRLRRAQSSRSGQGGLGAFWAELKRRKVMRVAITYAVVAWLIIQIAEATFENFGIPVWAFRFVVLMVLLGFPIALIMAWAFELTPEGIKTTKKAVAERGEAPVSEKQQRKRNWTAYAVGAVLPTVIFGTLALFFYIRLGSVSQEPVGDKSIAVLPLDNLSPDPENAFFADGVHEEILTNLSKINELLVIGRTSTLQYRGTVKPLKQIGSELGVKYLLEGSVQRAGDQVRVTVQLIDTASEGHLWAESYTRKLDDFFAIISSISKEIAGELQAVLSPQEIAEIERRPTQNQEAYDFFLMARQAPVGSKGRRSLTQKAVELDPDFFKAWQSVLVGGAMDYRSGHRSDPELLANTRYALSQVQRTAPHKSYYLHAQAVLAYNESNDMEGSTRLLLEAAQDLDNPDAQGTLAWRYMEMGKMAEALPFLELAIRSEPFNGPIIMRIVGCYKRLGMWDNGRQQLQKCLEQQPDNRRWKLMLASLDYLQSGDREAYIETLRSIRRNDEQDNYSAAAAATISRDFNRALELFNSGAGPDTAMSHYALNVAGFFDFKFELRSLETMNALIWFELGNRERWQLMAEQAKNRIQDVLFKDPIADPDYRSNLAICYALTGERDLMEKAIVEVREQTSSSDWKFRREVMTEMHIAIAYLVLGNHDKAIETLEAASEMDGPIFLNRELDLWFIFDRLRGNPRFEALLKD